MGEILYIKVMTNPKLSYIKAIFTVPWHKFWSHHNSQSSPRIFDANVTHQVEAVSQKCDSVESESWTHAVMERAALVAHGGDY